MVDAATKLHNARRRDERAAVQRAIKDLVAELVATPDGRRYKQVLEEMPEEHWRGFHFELMNALVVPRPSSYDPKAYPLSGLPGVRRKSALLADEHRKRRQLEAASRVEKIARMDVPGVTSTPSTLEFR